MLFCASFTHTCAPCFQRRECLDVQIGGLLRFFLLPSHGGLADLKDVTMLSLFCDRLPQACRRHAVPEFRGLLLRGCFVCVRICNHATHALLRLCLLRASCRCCDAVLRARLLRRLGPTISTTSLNPCDGCCAFACTCVHGHARRMGRCIEQRIRGKNVYDICYQELHAGEVAICTLVNEMNDIEALTPCLALAS